MTQTIIIKNGTNLANLTAAGLEQGELAINRSTDLLYYGSALGVATPLKAGALTAGAVGTNELANGAVTNAKIANDAVTLGTQTTGNYVATVAAGAGISVSGVGTETATATVALAASGVTPGTYNGLTLDTYGRVTGTTASGVIPDQAGNGGKFLKTDGTALSWSDMSGNSVTMGNWTITTSGTKLVFQYNGATVFSLASNGQAISADNVTAFGSP